MQFSHTDQSKLPSGVHIAHFLCGITFMPSVRLIKTVAVSRAQLFATSSTDLRWVGIFLHPLLGCFCSGTKKERLSAYFYVWSRNRHVKRNWEHGYLILSVFCHTGRKEKFISCLLHLPVGWAEVPLKVIVFIGLGRRQASLSKPWSTRTSQEKPMTALSERV